MNGNETIGESERWLSTVLGGMLVLSSLRRRDLTAGVAFALGGSALVYRGVTGHDGFFQALGRAVQDRLGGSTPAAVTDDWSEVDESSAESFPASDAPSWTPTSSVGPHEEEL